MARTARIEHRIAPEALEIVRRAAEAEGRSVSDFVTAAAYDAAVTALERHRGLREGMAAPWAGAEALRQSYADMAADAEREAEADDWIEGLIGDVAADG